MKDKENNTKAEAMIRLLGELNEGIRSGEEEGWTSEEEVINRNHQGHTLPVRGIHGVRLHP